MPSLHRLSLFRLRYGGRASKRITTEFCEGVLFVVSRWALLRLRLGKQNRNKMLTTFFVRPACNNVPIYRKSKTPGVDSDCVSCA